MGTQKKEEEVYYCTRVAEGINRAEGTDCYVKEPEFYLQHEDEPADVVLFSRSGRYPDRAAQVVTIPFDPQFRNSTDNLKRFEEGLVNALRARGLQNCMVAISPVDRGVLHCMPGELVNSFSELIREQTSQRQIWSLDSDAIDVFSEALGRYIDSVSCMCHSGVDVYVKKGCWSREDAEWIEEGIRKKAQGKYPITVTEKMVLVLGASFAVARQQPTAYLATTDVRQISFAEVWIVLFGGHAVCLKRRFGHTHTQK
jgi:hypothetical protein